MKLRLVNVSKRYGKRQTLVRAVSNVDLILKTGEIVLIMGPSGSGKTTLLSIAGGLLKPTSGRVFIGDKEISKLKSHELASIRLRRTGFVFQRSNLLESLNVLENVEAALNLNNVRGTEAINRAKEVIDSVNMSHRLTFHSNKLSAGEMQRVAIARALANNPDIILADEPTGNLDSKSGKRVMDLFESLVREQNKAAIIVTHDPRIKRIADRILWLEDGKLKKRKI